MATAQDIIKRARRLIGAIGRGETPTDAENVDDLYALNTRFDALWLQRNAVFRVEEITFTTSTISRTIGATGDVVATRPNEILSAYQRQSDVDYPIRILTKAQYDDIAFKTTQSSIIQDLWYDPTFPNGTMYFHPVPNASETVVVDAAARLETFTINETIALPPGYEEMMAYQLAATIAPEYQRQIPPEVAIKASTTLNNIKRQNMPPPQVAERGSRRYNIFTGD